MWYKLVLTNLGQSQSISIADQLPAGFTAVKAWCDDLDGVNDRAIATPFSAQVNLRPANSAGPGKSVCAIYGYFDHAAQQAKNAAAIVSAPKSNSNEVNTTIMLDQAIKLDIAKELISADAIDVTGAPKTSEFKITISNKGTVGAFLANVFTLRDELALLPGGAPLKIEFVSASCKAIGNLINLPPTDCLDAVNPKKYAPPLGTGYSPFLDWKFPAGSAGHIQPGGSIELTYTIKIDRDPEYHCLEVENADGFGNRAVYAIQYSGPAVGAGVTGVQEVKVKTGNAKVPCPPIPEPWSPIEVNKRLLPQPASPHEWSNANFGNVVRYEITVRNKLNKELKGVELDDVVENLPERRTSRRGRSKTS